MPLARAGVRVTALDASKALLDILTQKIRREDLKVEVVKCDIRSFQLGKEYPLIILPFQSFEELVTRSDQIEALTRIKEHLRDDGYFIVSIHNPGYHNRVSVKRPLNEFSERRTGHSIRFFINRTVRDHLAFNEQKYRGYDGDTLISERKFLNRSYVFHGGEFENLLKEAGFSIAQVWGGYKHELTRKDSRYLLYRLAKG